MQQEKKSLLEKIHSRGIQWLIARLLQEAGYHTTSKVGRFLRPLMFILYRVVLLPINKVKSRKLQKNSYANKILYLFYDLEVSPVTFDFAWALVLADLERRAKQLDNLQIIFVPGKKNGLREEDPEYEAHINYYSRTWRCHEILYAMCRLLPACTGITVCSSREEANILCEKNRPNIFPKQYSVVFPVAHVTAEAMKTLSHIMVLRATEQARVYIKQWLKFRLKNRKLVTITLRESAYMPARNSHLPSWAAFARSLDLEKYFVVFVPDADTAFEELPKLLAGFNYLSAPCWNLNLRAALYELSYLNLGVNNGAMALCWLNEKCRYITFKMLTPEVPQTSKSAFKKQGIEIGQSLPFVSQFQKWVWENDTTTTILHEFNLMCRLIEAKYQPNDHEKVSNLSCQ